jgi:hypothetical protein
MMACWHSMLREVAKEESTPHSCNMVHHAYHYFLYKCFFLIYGKIIFPLSEGSVFFYTVFCCSVKNNVVL